MPKGNPISITKTCCACGESFAPVNNNQKYCKRLCRRTVYRVDGSESTVRQYQLISGNWYKYFNRLCSRSFKRENLTPEMLEELLNKQDGKCALTGVELTCILEKGVVSKTNASIDRIDPKGAYSLDNIQLVCAVMNKFRIDTPLEEFIEWCRKVAENAVYKN